MSTITETITHGITLGSDGYNSPLTIANAGGVTNNLAFEDAISGGNAAVTVVNAGSIVGGGSAGYGVVLTAGGSITNQSGGAITGYNAIYGKNAAVTVVNAGIIAGSNENEYLSLGLGGVDLDAGGSVTNQSGGTITGHDGILGAGTTVAVVNAGSITGRVNGVYLKAGGSVTNQSGGAITGDDGIVGDGGAVTVVNAGTITGSIDAVRLSAGYANRLIIDPGAVFSGTVTGGNTIGSTVVSTLELAAGASAGTLSGLGTQFVGFAQVTVDAGAQFTLTGANTLAAGYAFVDAGTLTNAGAISGDSALTLASGGVLSNASTGTITVSDGTAVYGMAGGAATVVNAGVIAGSAASGGQGIDLAAGGTVIDGGTITGAAAVLFGGTASNLLILTHGYALQGGVYGSASASNTLELLGTSSAASVTANYNGLSLTNFGTVAFAPTATNYATLKISNDATLPGTITNFTGAYDTIDLTTLGFVSASSTATLNTASDQLTVSNGSTAVTLQLGSGTYSNLSFSVASDGAGGTDITAVQPRFTIQNETELNAAIAAISIGGADAVPDTDDMFTFASGFTLTSAVSAVSLASGSVLDINGGGVTLNGGAGAYGFLADPGAVTVQNLTVVNSQETVVSGATWTLAGSVGVGTGATLIDSGTLINAGTLVVDSPITVTGTFINSSIVSAPGTDTALYLATGGVLTNAAAGTISAGTDAVTAAGTVSITNLGTITGTTASGIALASGNVINGASGSTAALISGGIYAITASGLATVANYGTISGPSSGVDMGVELVGGGVRLSAGGSVTNQSGGAISGFDGIVGEGSAVTVVNAGAIAGGRYAVYLQAGYANRLIIDPGAVFSGTVTGGNTIGSTVVSTLELAAGASVGTLSGLGTKYIDFAQVTVDAGAQFTLAGANTIAAGYTLTNAGKLTDAGSLTNAGILSSDSTLTLAPGGVLSNASTGTVSVSDGTAVDGMAGGAATVVNAGVIAGVITSFSADSGDGVYLAAGGGVTNQSGGTISGYRGIVGDNAVTVVNAGSIAGNEGEQAGRREGVGLHAGGSVTNQSGGAISGEFGIAGYSAATVVNAGSIAGTEDGVYLSAGGSATNQNGGTITGGTGGGDAGVDLFGGDSVTNQSGGTISGFDGISGAGILMGDDIPEAGTAATVVNAGTIAGSDALGGRGFYENAAGRGIYLLSGGSVTNQSGGAISGFVGIYGYYAAVTVVNAGRIVGTIPVITSNDIAGLGNNAGVRLFAGGSITNQSGGTIYGFYEGIYGKNAAVTVVNAGSISAAHKLGDLKYGIFLNAGGSVTNQSGGAITGHDGIYGKGGAVTVVNAGTIAAYDGFAQGYGVFFSAGGSVTNQSGGSISGGRDGIYGKGGAVTVVNAGRITGQYDGTGVALHAGGNVTNQSGGVIYGYRYGIGGAATLVNYGSIAGHYDGVALNGASVTNQSGGEISGYDDGVDGAVTLVNAGTIAGNATNGTGVALDGDGSVSNQSGGAISGKVGIEGTAPTVVNAGTIAGNATNGTGIDLDGGGSVTNQTGGAITGGSYGIEFSTAGSIVGEGSVTNHSGGTISGNDGIIGEGTALTVMNAGSIAGVNKGVYLDAGGSVTNQTGGTISGDDEGIFGDNAAVTVVNAGSIAANAPRSGNTTNGDGVYLAAGGSVTNQSGGAISGEYGIYGRNAAVTVVNAGTITGSIAGNATLGSGVRLLVGGNVTNQSGGAISGGSYGIFNANAVVNAGTIAGNATSGVGVLLFAGSVTNQSGGTISGDYGILSFGAVTVVNAGTITGDKDAVKFAAGYTNRLVIDPGAVFSGTVTGGNTIGAGHVSTLELATGASAGTLSELGTQFIDFAHVTVDTGAQFTLTGANTIAAGVTLTDAGSLTNAGILSVYSALTLVSGGALSNASTGTITAPDGTAVYGATGGAATVVNAGVIAGSDASGGKGINLSGGGSVTNQTGGAITGGNYGIEFSAAGSVTNQSGGAISGNDGIYVRSGAVTVVNAGSIAGSDANGSRGIDLNDGGSVTNQTGGAITGELYGIFSHAAATVVNAGSIAGNTADGKGVYLYAGGSVTNQSGGAITGGLFGIDGEGTALTVVNAGSISGTEIGVDLFAGGRVTNQTGGTITGGQYAVYFAAGHANRLIIDPGAVFSGTVSGGNTIGSTVVSTLELAAGASAGTLSGLGTKYIDFAQVTVDVGAQFTLAGANTLAAGTLTDAGKLTNAGILSSDSALTLAPGGVLSNASTGTISGSNGTAVYGATGGAATVVNAGVIAGSDASGGKGINLNGGGSVTNQTGGAITGRNYGIEFSAAGSVTNQSGGAISGNDGIYVRSGAVTVVNAGTIAGSDASGSRGIDLTDGGSVTNQTGGAISGELYGIFNTSRALTVVNAGTIAGDKDAVEFGGSGGNLLVVDSGAVFNGDVLADGTGNTLELASAASAGTLTGIGSQFTGFDTIQIDTGAAWTISGGMDGFNGDSISGFTGLDTIDVTGFTAATETIALGSNDVLTVGDLALTFTGAETNELFAIASDGNGGTDITLDTLCYLRGTRILTPTGALPVEDIAIGDLLVTRFAGMAKVKWIGRQSFDLRFVQDNRDRLPVRIRAGALGEKLPARDLYVSPGHSMLLDNTLVLARNLVNGVSITQETGMASNPAVIDYFQFELDSHDCVIAEGAWSETYADAPGLRGQFQNAAEFYALYPDQPPPQQLELCAPRPEHGAGLDAALRQVVARASEGILPGALEGYIDLVDTWRIEGWALDQDHPELPVLLEIWVEDRLLGTVLACDHRGDLLEAGKGNGNCAFFYHLPMRLPEGELRIVRAADGAALRVSDYCRTKAEATTPAATPVALSAVA
jgi:predicted ribosome-associated RNA-binding protein Tma20